MLVRVPNIKQLLRPTYIQAQARLSDMPWFIEPSAYLVPRSET
jgi:hypothetical protein